ncbi:hypothetical protein [Moraxella bovoculi]|nr:hypothetical protein [Moraxella bovoculi]
MRDYHVSRYHKNVSAALLVGFLSSFIHAHASQIDEQSQDDRRLQSADQPFELPKPVEPELTMSSPQAQTMMVDDQALLAQPELLARAMLSALVYLRPMLWRRCCPSMKHRH